MLGSPGVSKAPDVSQVSFTIFSHVFCPATNSKQSEIEAFHAEHFSSAAVELFASEFIQPQPPNDDQYYEEYYEEYEEEDDGLGYYPDGVKRTLTDEQIAIFRHSELEALRRVEEKASAHGSRNHIEVGDDTHDNDAKTTGAFSMLETNTPEDGEEGEEGEIESDTPKPSSATASKKKKKKKSKKGKNLAASNAGGSQQGESGWFKRTVKPDLRKRTWDVVETGMDSLDYDELDGGAGRSTGQTAQRRKISYDD